MATWDALVAALGSYGTEQYAAGATSRDGEVQDLTQKLNDALVLIKSLQDQLAKATVPDYPEVTTDADLRAAVAGLSAVTVNTTISLNAPLKIPTAGAVIYLGESGLIQRTFDNPGGSTKQSLFINADWTKPIQGFTITGPGKLGAAGGVHGNIIGVWADDIYFRDWSVDYWTGGRLFIGGGERMDVANITARSDPNAGSGVGGWRVSLGSGVIADCDIECGDDCLQGVCAGGSSDPLRNLGDIHDLTYRNCTGRSFTARFMVLGLQGEAMTASIRGVTFENCVGYGGGAGVNIANHAPSSGSITGVSFPGCRVDQSKAGTTTDPNHGQPSEFYIQRDPGTGSVDDIDASGMTMVLSTRIAGRTKPLYKPNGVIGSNVELPVAA